MYFWIYRNHTYYVAAHRIISLASQMGMYRLFATRNSVWLWQTSRISMRATPFSTVQTRLN